MGGTCVPGTSFILPWGWRLSLGLAGVPASMLFLGGLCLPDTPVSLIQRGKPDMGRKVQHCPLPCTLYCEFKACMQQLLDHTGLSCDLHLQSAAGCLWNVCTFCKVRMKEKGLLTRCWSAFEAPRTWMQSLQICKMLSSCPNSATGASSSRASTGPS